MSLVSKWTQEAVVPDSGALNYINMLDSVFALLNTLTFWKAFCTLQGICISAAWKQQKSKWLKKKKKTEWKWCNRKMTKGLVYRMLSLGVHRANSYKAKKEIMESTHRKHISLQFLVSMNMLEQLIQWAAISLRQKCTIDSYSVFHILRSQQALLAVCLSFKFYYQTGNTYVVHCN